MSTIVEISEGIREVFPNVNSQLGILALTSEYLYCEWSRLCAESPINFVGSLLVEKHKFEFLEELRKEKKEVSDRLVHPLYKVADVILFTTEIKAQSISFKNACGATGIGIVTQGDLTGLIVEDVGDLHGAQTASALRLFNDSVIPDYARYRPYTPAFYPNWEEIPVEAKLRDPVIQRLERRFKTLYYNLAEKEAKRLGYSRNLRTSDLFFAACEEAGVELDKENFHFTRPNRGTF